MSEINDLKNEKLIIGDDVFVPFLTEEQIQNRIKSLRNKYHTITKKKFQSL